VPWLLPGTTLPVQKWSPSGGLSMAGNLTYAPEPGTGWKDIDPSKFDNIVDALHNESVYRAAQEMLGERLAEVTTGLLVGGGTDTTASGIVYASGCVPHACGVSDGFMAIDAAGERLYFAREGDGQPETWPALAEWPAELRSAMDEAFAPKQ
jgi:hypothetical protein